MRHASSVPRAASSPRLSEAYTRRTPSRRPLPQYAAFLAASAIARRWRSVFLAHLHRRPAASRAGRSSGGVCDLADARAYARWAGKTAADGRECSTPPQDPTGDAYPWGEALVAGACNDGQPRGGTTPVSRIRRAARPFAVDDL